MPALVVTVATSCGGDSAPGRAATLEPIVSSAVPERYAGWSDEAAALADAVETACADADGVPAEDARAALQVETRAVRASWARLEPFWIGPTIDRRAEFLVDWAIDPHEVDELAAGDGPVDEAALRDVVAADQRGLSALAHLLDGPLDARRCAYAAGNARLVAGEAEALASDWVDFGPSLAVDGAAADDALGDIVSETLFIMSSLNDMNDAEIQVARVDGVRWVYFGDEPPIEAPAAGDDPLEAVDGISPLVTDDVAAQLELELDAALEDPRGDAAMAVEVTIGTNVVSGLNLTVSFSDADGDGG